MLVPESGRNSRSAWGPPFGEFISHMSSFLKKNQGGLIASAFSLKLFLVWLPVLIFLKLKKTPGKVRNRSETGQKHQKGSTCLASIHPSTSSLIIATSTSTITITTSTTSTTSTTTSTTSTTSTTTTTATTTTTPTTTNSTSTSTSTSTSISSTSI